MVSILIVSFNTVREVLACLASIERGAASVPHEVDVILVDNGSADGTVEAVRAQFPAVRLIANDANVGFPKANNQALPLVRGEYVLFLNPDSELAPGTLERMLAQLDGFPERAAAGPRVRTPSAAMPRRRAAAAPLQRERQEAVHGPDEAAWAAGDVSLLREASRSSVRAGLRGHRGGSRSRGVRARAGAAPRGLSEKGATPLG